MSAPRSLDPPDRRLYRAADVTETFRNFSEPGREGFVITSVRTALVGALAAALIPLTTSPATAEQPGGDGTVDFGQHLQPIDGFGFSQAFQRADVMHGAQGLTPRHQREVLDLLLNRATGAGLSILRLGVGSSSDEVYDHMKSIQPTDPGGPDAPARYVWDGDDGGQVWLAKEAKRYGVTRFYADAWSAPGYMKTNGTDANGGTLKEEWRRAYANYLAQYATFYRQEGVRITDLGFTNEPDLATSYASMQFTPRQAVEAVKAIGPTVRRAGINVQAAVGPGRVQPFHPARGDTGGGGLRGGRGEDDGLPEPERAAGPGDPQHR
ncbi:hypothetical protein SSPO_067640 [Streptomyces antimycoticus]|uniref:Endo-beta-1,6-galactanase-like domain-containing protein n=1 Tax=Streptomyces antimycoticus TaxID=68175 RepID=A0A499V6X0_9ACTN|nr:hypothetical protein SSPO_067640 [Streptomyces antimycoticus]